MKKNSPNNPLTQEERAKVWEKIDKHAMYIPADLDTNDLSTWSLDDFKRYQKWSDKQHELRRLLDLH